MSEPARDPYGPYTDEILELAQRVRSRALRNLERSPDGPAPRSVQAAETEDKPVRRRPRPRRTGV